MSSSPPNSCSTGPCSGSLPEETTNQLPLDILAKIWPAERVMLGIQVCRWLRDELPAVAEEITLVACATPVLPLPFSPESISRSLLRCREGRATVVCRNALLAPESATKMGASEVLRAVVEGLSSALISGLDGCLTHLDISCCRLGSADLLVPVLAKCTALEFANLSSNALRAEGLAKIAEALDTNAKTLKTLDLSRNSAWDATAVSMSKVSVACAKLENLTTLKFNDQFFREEGATGLAVGLRECTALTLLDFSNTRLEDAGLQELSSAFAQCVHLRDLQLSGNQCSGQVGGKAISAGVGRWDPDRDVAPCARSALTRLNLSDNELGEDAWMAAAGLRQCTRLCYLDLSFNRVADSAVQRMCGMLPAVSLTHLELSDNILGRSDPHALVALLQELSELQRLGLADNSLGDEGAKLLAEHVFEHVPRLTDLDLAGNGIGDVGGAGMARHLGGCGRLKICRLTRNEVGRAGREALLAVNQGRECRIEFDLRFNPKAGGRAEAKEEEEEEKVPHAVVPLMAGVVTQGAGVGEEGEEGEGEEEDMSFLFTD